MSTDPEYMTAHDRRLEYKWFGPGPGDAPTLVFLHEGLGCADLWRDFPASLSAATGCGALVYSRLGYGRSDACEVPRPLEYMQIEAREWLGPVLDGAGIERCVLIGHSDGGSIALLYAGAVDDPRVLGLILEAPHVFCEDVSVRSIAAARDAFEDGNLRRRLARYHGENVDCAFWGWNRAWLDPDFMNWNIEDYLPAVTVPMLVLQGKDDQYGTRAQVDAIVRQAGGPVELLMLDDCAHSPHGDQEEETLQAMAGFIRSATG